VLQRVTGTTTAIYELERRLLVSRLEHQNKCLFRITKAAAIVRRNEF